VPTTSPTPRPTGFLLLDGSGGARPSASLGLHFLLMRILPQADKWIVFGTFAVVGAVNLSGSRGILSDLFEWVFACLGMGGVFALIYVLWSAAWRWIARRRQPNPPTHVRLLSNATFCLLAIGIIWIPIPAFKMKIELPKKVEIHR
jgi:hypothetical protein